jgi:uncharacterized protein
MIIALRSVLHGPRQFDFTLEPDWWQSDDEEAQILGLDGSLKVHINISSEGGRYLLHGNLSGAVQVVCARCLEPYHSDLEFDFRLRLAPAHPNGGETEMELLEDDMSVDFITGSEIDLYDIVREQIYLSQPMKSLCGSDCRGLCPICGINLNKDKCDCRRKAGHPGFSTLKNFKLKGE